MGGAMGCNPGVGRGVPFQATPPPKRVFFPFLPQTLPLPHLPCSKQLAKEPIQVNYQLVTEPFPPVFASKNKELVKFQ